MGQIRDESVNLTSAGTAQRFSATTVPALWVRLQARGANSGDVVVGGKTVVGAATTRRGILLSVTLTKIPGPLDLTDLWFDGTSTDDDIDFIYAERD